MANQKLSIKNNATLKRSKTLLCTGDTEVSDEVRKSLRDGRTRSETEVIPSTPFFSALPFLSFFSLFSVVRLRFGVEVGLQSYLAVLLIGASGRVGVSVNKLMYGLHMYGNDVSYRAVGLLVLGLLEKGVVSRYRYKGYYLYTLSLSTENIFYSVIGRKEFVSYCKSLKESLYSK